MKALNPIRISGREVLPLIEGGKGIAVSNGESSGAWAAAGGVGTFSGVNADSYDEDGKAIPQHYYGRTRRERHEELIARRIFCKRLSSHIRTLRMRIRESGV